MVLALMPNPGVGRFGALLGLQLAGAGHWGGGDEGLNASIGMTAVLVALLLLMLLRPERGRPGPAAA